MANCPKCGNYVNVAGEVCGSCRRAMKDAAELTRLQTKETKKRMRESNNSGGGGSGRFHGIYCLLIGWWLAAFLAMLIVPLFFRGGRRLIKKAFGIW